MSDQEWNENWETVMPEGSAEGPTGELAFHVITMEDLSIRTEALPHAACTCTWKTKPSNNLADLGLAAFKHAAENPGHILRPHAQ